MLKIRRFEERTAQLYGLGHIGGFCHLYIGQEAVVVGVLMTIDKNDSVVTTYRDHGHMISRGLDPKKIMAELTGKKNGYSSGKGGSMHMFSKENNFFIDRIKRLQPNTLDTDYLEEKLRKNTGFSKNNEIVIIFD